MRLSRAAGVFPLFPGIFRGRREYFPQKSRYLPLFSAEVGVFPVIFRRSRGIFRYFPQFTGIFRGRPEIPLFPGIFRGRPEIFRYFPVFSAVGGIFSAEVAVFPVIFHNFPQIFRKFPAVRQEKSRKYLRLLQSARSAPFIFHTTVTVSLISASSGSMFMSKAASAEFILIDEFRAIFAIGLKTISGSLME